MIFPDAQSYGDRLTVRFPSLLVHVAETYAHAAPYLADTQILITTGRGLDAETVRAMPRLEWIHCLISGIDQLTVAREARPEVIISSSSGIHGPQMAEMAVLHMLALSRQIVRLERQRSGHKWVDLPQRVLDQKSVGIVGLGAAGTRLAELCKAFNMTVYGVSRTRRSERCFDSVFGRDQLCYVASIVDFLVLVVPQSSETIHLIDGTVLGAMKPTSMIVNLARGGVVDERALVDALVAGRIAGAGLDVTATEPLPASSPLWQMENVVLTPHLAGHTDRYLEQVWTVLEPNMERFLAGMHVDMINSVQ
ncbi:MAG: D-2-hydroxyacid dehydrogenase [Candidatus Dormibacteraeota bacterium]|uniref:D-2-hydroxyacid dehydrogenase n=1 Tax=Candidatus Dormiibacter inghamiae TaxID=3127013 RepID=A0A934NBU6_9BACT|nr:D-2-hydroxyacid dehydrogenase [Candidatus Dormibacteraeota bacterium]